MALALRGTRRDRCAPRRRRRSSAAGGHRLVLARPHPDNAGRTRGRLPDDGRLRWVRTGVLPLRPDPALGRAALTAAGLVPVTRPRVVSR